MARLESVARAGFYPFDMRYMDALTSMFLPGSGKILDPFAGEGEALEALAKKWNLTPYANELDKQRAKICADKFGILQAVNEDAEKLRASENAFVCVFNNPPYGDHIDIENNEDFRKELAYLKLARRWLIQNGYMIWVVYSHHLSEKAAAYIAKNYSSCDVYFIPEKHLGEYRQIVVVLKNGKSGTLTSESVLEAKAQMKELRVIETPIYKFPPAPNSKRFIFAAQNITADFVLSALQETNAFNNPRFQAAITARPVIPDLKPLRQPRPGQMALILATGLFNGLILKNKDGKKFAVRSVVRPVEKTVSTEETDNSIITKTHLKPETTISLLYENGEIEKLEGDVALIGFIKEHHDKLIEYFNEHYKPLYKEDYSEFANIIDSARLKGGKSQLFPAQKHAVAAAATKLVKDKRSIIVGDMGFGKSAIATVVMKILQQRFDVYADDNGNLFGGQIVVIACPGTLLNKWKREILDIYPDSNVVILDDDAPSKRRKTYTAIEKAARLLRDADRYPLRLHVGIVKYETLKNSEIKQPAVKWLNRPTRETFEIFNRQKYEYETISRIKRPIEIDKLPHCPVFGNQIFIDGKKTKIPKPSYFEAEPRFNRTGNKKVALWHEIRSFKKSQLNDDAAKNYSEWLKSVNGYNGNIHKKPKIEWVAPRYSIANFLSKVGKKRIGLFIVDEVHKAKETTTDVGAAVQRLSNVADRVLGLTGTLFGGKSSSVFYLEHIFNPHWMNENFPYRTGQLLWQTEMGVIEKIYEQEKTLGSGAGRYTGRRREAKVVSREIAGISPMLVKAVLDHCIFVGMNELRDDMPKYDEIRIPVEMSPEMYDTYAPMESFLKSYLMDCLMDRDNSFMGAYLHTLIEWPSAPFRGGEIIHRIKTGAKGIGRHARGAEEEKIEEYKVYEVKGLPENILYPKEEWLLETIKDELAEKRGVCVYISQTDTKDIRPRILELIKQYVPNAKPWILSSSIGTDRREEKIFEMERQGYNVMICNPKLVEVGLDMLMFPTLIFYEVNYSLYIMSQASRRSWRANQTRPCKTLYPYYVGTMEEQAVRVIAKKAKAANLLYGSLDSGGLEALAEDTSTILSELAQMVKREMEKNDVVRP